MLLSVVIISYNTAELTLQTLKSAVVEIQNSELLTDKSEIWIVDNNSQDDSVAQLAAFAKPSRIPIHILKNALNPGYATANNQAIQQSSGEYVLLLNSDTIVKPGAIEHMIGTFMAQTGSEVTSMLSTHTGELDRIGILSSQLLNPDGTTQAQGGSFPTLLSLTAHMLFLDDLPGVGKLLPSTQHTGQNTHWSNPSGITLIPKDWIAGTVMMVKRSVFEEIGLLDEQIFMYGEDMEFCLRAANHHWDCAIDLEAEIIHYGSASSSSSNAIIGELKGYRYIWSKHKSLWQIPVARVILMLGCVLRILLFGTILSNPAKVQAYKTALKYV